VLFFFTVRGCVESSDSFIYPPFCCQFNLFFNIHRFGLCKIITVYHSGLCKPFLYVRDCVIFFFIIHRSGLSKFLFMGRDYVKFILLFIVNFSIYCFGIFFQAISSLWAFYCGGRSVYLRGQFNFWYLV
jgi:hypothetical protein